ncbi:MAG: DUF4358 domain-containing protein [Clostridiales bacterium]|nr:DUF4358 domain-containing protein [Clostridiales bacterium]
MKKIISVVLLILVCLSVFSCCGKETKDDDEILDLTVLAESLRTEIEYTYPMESVEKEVALDSYFVDANDVASVVMYSSGSASAEEVAAFTATSAEAAERICDAAKQRIADQIELYTDYVPEEIPKLNNAIVYQKGLYVVVSVSPDNTKADDIIKEFFK